MQLLLVGTRDQSDNDGGHGLTRVSGDEARLWLASQPAGARCPTRSTLLCPTVLQRPPTSAG